VIENQGDTMKSNLPRPFYCVLALLPLVLAPSLAAGADPLPRAEPAKAGFSAQALARIDRFYADEIARDRIPGAVVAIAREGKLVYYKAIGYQDKAAGTPLKTDAIFNLASMTKPLTVVSALTLYEEGRLPLKSTLATYYPQFSSMQVGVVDANGAVKLEPAKPIYVQDLMRHTSGLTYGARGNTPVHKMYPASSAAAAFSMTGPEFMDALAKLPLLYPPGTTWDYGFSVDVLGQVVEKITGKSLGAASAERVWAKLAMRDTTFQVPADKRARLAQPLANDPVSGKPQNIRILHDPVKFDCGGSCAFSTAADYIRFGQMLVNGGALNGVRILSPKTVRLMTSDHLGKNIKNNVAGTEAGRDGYGFGLGVAVRIEPGVAATNGTVGDYTWNGANGTIFWVDPKEKLVVVVMSVGPGEIRKYYREQIAALVYGAMVR
jgi:CubicO group peptidase (beta-lactamase class C family)